MREQNNMADKKPVTFEVTKEIEILSSTANGWSKQVNMVSWNGGEAKLDIRSWNEDRSKMGKGITLNEEEVELLKGCLTEND